MTPRSGEEGTALLTVLLLVAVIATIAATVLDRIGIATRLAGNVAAVAQSRAWLGTAEALTMARIEDLIAADGTRTTTAGNWMGVERTVTLPDGSVARAKVADGGNCFNLNSLVEERGGGLLVARERGARQFAALMRVLGVQSGQAEKIADMTADYIDSDGTPLRLGGEDSAYSGSAAGLPANQLMADPSELRAVAGVTPRDYQLLRPWICALPTTDMSPININTLLPEQAPLLSMLVPDVLDLSRARTVIASRPADGYEAVIDFWKSPALEGLPVAPEASQQVRLKTDFFAMEAIVRAGNVDVRESALIDAREKPARIVARQWGEAS